MTFNAMLAQFVNMGASDIHLHAGLRPIVRVSGRLLPVGQQVLLPSVTASLVELMCDARKRAIFADKHQVDTAYSIPDLGRFRVNLFRQRGSVSAVLRVINSDETQLVRRSSPLCAKTPR